MKKVLLTFLLLFLMIGYAKPATINVPSEQTTIQAGINAAVDGDTVLVADGTYKGDGNRDIDFKGKAIVVISVNGVMSTIINCEGTLEEQHRGFNFHNNENYNSVVSGFTIINGFVSDILSGGGGILCDLSSPKIENCLFRNNTAFLGSGIFLMQSDAIIKKSTFIDIPDGRYMIAMAYSSPLIEYCSLDGFNSVDLVFCKDSEPKFKKNLFYSNNITEWSECLVDYVGKRGNFIGNPYYCRDSSSLQERSSCLPKNNNIRQLVGALNVGCDECDLIVMPLITELSVTKFLLETIKIPLPIKNHYTIVVEPPNASWKNDTLYFIFDSVNKFRYTVTAFSDCDTSYSEVVIDARVPKILYVPNEFLTIQDAIDAASEYDTVMVADGVYKGNGNRDIRVKHRNFILMSQNGPEHTTIDCQEEDGRLHQGLNIRGAENTVVIDGFTIQNGYHRKGAGIYCSNSSPIIRNCIIKNNNASYDIMRGGGLYCFESSPTVINCAFINNTANSGGGIFSIYSTPTFVNCVIAKNISTFGGGGVYCWDSSPIFNNCTITENYTDGYGAGVYLDRTSVSVFQNCIISFHGNGGGLYYRWSDAIPFLTCSNVFGNEGGDWIGGISDQLTFNGNFSLDPLFCDVVQNDFNLKSNSPCSPVNNSCGELIGALDVHCVQTDIKEMNNLLPQEFALNQNYPNPFNPTTTIDFNLPIKSNVSIYIYNLLGQKIKQLVNQEFSAGIYSVTWDGTTEEGVQTSSGIYFYRIETDSFTETKKMLLLK